MGSGAGESQQDDAQMIRNDAAEQNDRELNQLAMRQSIANALGAAQYSREPLLSP